MVNSPLYSKKSVQVDAVIADVKTHRGDKGNLMYSAVFEYTFDGRLIRAQEGGSSSLKPEIGEKVRLLLYPEKPENPTQKSLMNYIFPWIFLSLGVLAMGATVKEIIKR